MAVALAAAATLPVAAGEASASFPVSVTMLDAGAASSHGGTGAVCRADAQTGAAGCVPAVPSNQWQWRPVASSTGTMNLASAAVAGSPGGAASGGSSDAPSGPGATAAAAGAGSSQAASQATSAEPRSAPDGSANYLELMISW